MVLDIILNKLAGLQKHFGIAAISYFYLHKGFSINMKKVNTHKVKKRKYVENT